MKKGKLIMSASMGFIAFLFTTCIFIQFKTINKVNINDLENIRESELREQLSNWKSKYQEVDEKLADNNNKIEDYKKSIGEEHKTSEVLQTELEQSNLFAGNEDCYGEGVIITLKNNNEYDIMASDLLELVNELNYAGAEAISINDIRITATTDIVNVGDTLLVGGTRVAEPYTVKAIGNKTYLTSVLNLKNSGFIDKYTNSGRDVKVEESDNVKISAYSWDINAEYMKED